MGSGRVRASAFNVIYLGSVADIDPTEGNQTAENAGTLVGRTFGGVGQELGLNIHSFSPGSTGYGGGAAGHYDTSNACDRFRIDGGANKYFDSTVGYAATLTYTDGTTATITAVVLQSTDGSLYLAPEIDANADQALLDAKPIRSITFTAGNGYSNTGMWYDRQIGDYKTPICFVAGTGILTPGGTVPVERLRPGHRVCTLDNGPQSIRWVGSVHFTAGYLARHRASQPVRLPEGFLGARRPVPVSPQHGVLTGQDRLVRAKHFCGAPGMGVRVARGKRGVAYHHLLFDRHEILLADGLAAESCYPGREAIASLSARGRERLARVAPETARLCAGLADCDDLFGPRARRVCGASELRGMVRMPS